MIRFHIQLFYTVVNISKTKEMIYYTLIVKLQKGILIKEYFIVVKISNAPLLLFYYSETLTLVFFKSLPLPTGVYMPTVHVK